ncbi:MAG: phenylalanine--tRNA ligase subunit alpha [Patescibacteria group bacterium]|nr:phenylalanine--tRNA ligase subunit alpha [Patescibacteria group bacterium]
MINLEELNQIEKNFLNELKLIKDLKQLNDLRVKLIGRNGLITNYLKNLKDLTLEQKRFLGPKLQELKIKIENFILEKENELEYQNLIPDVDLTKPAKRLKLGHLHPLSLVEIEIRKIFSSMNFSVIDGPELELEYYNFDALNVLANHPARDVQDTFWIKDSIKDKKTNSRYLLRTHTSPMQVRYMENHHPPFQIIVPGKVYRNEALDAGHEINFYQLEGLVVSKNITLANFKFIIEEFFKRFFKGEKIEFRYRPSYFPFVEPGLELIIKYHNKWFEVAGAGMVHKHVFEYVHYNPRDFQGFAFGMGIDRLAMIKYKIPDIRLFYSGDLRFVNQF